MNRSQIYHNVTYDAIVRSMTPCLQRCVLCNHLTGEEILDDWRNVLCSCMRILKDTKGRLGVSYEDCVGSVIHCATEGGWFCDGKWQALAALLLAAKIELQTREEHTHTTRAGVLPGLTPKTVPTAPIPTAMPIIDVRDIFDKLTQLQQSAHDPETRAFYSHLMLMLHSAQGPTAPGSIRAPPVRAPPTAPTARPTATPSPEHENLMRQILKKLHLVHEGITDVHDKVDSVHDSVYDVHDTVNDVHAIVDSPPPGRRGRRW